MYNTQKLKKKSKNGNESTNIFLRLRYILPDKKQRESLNWGE